MVQSRLSNNSAHKHKQSAWTQMIQTPHTETNMKVKNMTLWFS